LRSDQVSGTCLISTTIFVMAVLVLLARVRPTGRPRGYRMSSADHTMLLVGNLWWFAPSP
jgi:hypothetical protein